MNKIKKNSLVIIGILLLLNGRMVFSQDMEEVKSYNYFTFYYLDNSEGYEADFMNAELTNELKNNLNRLAARADNYFLLFACNGDNYKIVNDLKSLTGTSSPFLKKYLSKASNEANYSEDKKAIREHLCEYPVKSKQNVEINYYLSSNALKKMVKNMEELPTPLTFSSELLTYIDGKDLKIRMNIYVDKADLEKMGSEKIKSYFIFCNHLINSSNIQTELIGM